MTPQTQTSAATLNPPPAADRFDLRQAHEEGWTLIDGCGPDGEETLLRGIDRSDHHAWFNVTHRAREGSPYHRDALSRLSPAARREIALRFGAVATGPA